MKPPVDAPTSRQTRPAGSISNASSAAASLWPPRLTYGSRSATRDGRVSGEQVARLQVRARGVALAHPDLAGEDERLGLRPRLGQAALDEELVQALSGRLAAGVPRRSRAHPRIVAQPASPRITSPGGTPP